MITKIKDYFQKVIEELKKVTWPSRQDLIKHTIAVVITIIISGAVVAIFDFGFNKILELTIKEV